jgi:endoglucanase
MAAMKAPHAAPDLRRLAAHRAPSPPGGAELIPAIKVNTVGYPTGWRKVAIATVEPTAAAIYRMAGPTSLGARARMEATPALTLDPGQVMPFGLDGASGDRVWQLDFSALDRPGRYVLVCGESESPPFEIAADVYERALLAAQKSFYFQRTRTSLAAPHAVWEGRAYLRERPSHDHEEVGWDLNDYPDKRRRFRLEAGWHDAGNFDIYVPSLAPAAQALLMAYEWAPERFADNVLGIPESGNGAPDLLDEVRWGLRWLLSMQEESGAFRHRESVTGTSPEGPADRDSTVRWVAGVSTAATAKAVATLALAARLYPRWDDVFAVRAGQAARRGWAFLGSQPEQIRADRRAGGAQPLWDDEPAFNDLGARFVAAVEMWRSFRDPDALAYATERVRLGNETGADASLRGAWANLSRWGLAGLAVDPATPPDLRQESASRLMAMAEAMRPQIETSDGYRCASTPDDYYWGHNSNLMEKTHILAVTARLFPERNWLVEAARDQWHWVLGRNPIGSSMVTGVGRGPTRMYHLEWGDREPPPPGFLIGGPNAKDMGFLAPGAPAKALLWDNPRPLRSGLPPHSLWHWRQSDLWDGGFLPEGSYEVGWWTTTEPDILYSANLVLAGVTLP